VPADIRNPVRHINRENPFGRAVYSWRTAVTRYRDRAGDGRQIHGPASLPTVSGLAHLLAQPDTHIAAIDRFVVPTIKFELLYGLVILRLGRRPVMLRSPR
jgi:hypothetical protein